MRLQKWTINVITRIIYTFCLYFIYWNYDKVGKTLLSQLEKYNTKMMLDFIHSVCIAYLYNMKWNDRQTFFFYFNSLNTHLTNELQVCNPKKLTRRWWEWKWYKCFFILTRLQFYKTIVCLPTTSRRKQGKGKKM